MIDDFTMVVHTLDPKMPYINIYPLGDLHVGSPQFNQELFEKWVTIVENDPYAKIVLLGDLINNAIKSSKSNCYEEVIPPSKQKEYLEEKLSPIKDKILGVIGGNHENRSKREVDGDPLYDVMGWLGLRHLYRPNVCFMKLVFGRNKKKNDRNIVYTGTLIHGASKTKNVSWGYSIDGQDFAFSGHTHDGNESEPAKIKINAQNGTVSIVPFRRVVVNSFLKYGGYAIEKQYLPLEAFSYQVVRLYNGVKKTDYMSINY